MDYLIEHEDEQITVIKLIDKMSEFCGDMAYTSVHMKSKLQDYFGDNVIITELNGKRNVITLRKTARVILHEFHQNQSLSDPEQEKRNIIKTAANLIKSDIKSIESAKNEYPSVSDIESIEKNLEYLPESLKIFLSSMFSERECRKTIINWAGYNPSHKTPVIDCTFADWTCRADASHIWFKVPD